MNAHDNKYTDTNHDQNLEFARLLGDIDPQLVASAAEIKPHHAHRRTLLLVALITVLFISLSTMALAMVNMQQQNSEFYLRSLSPENLNLVEQEETSIDDKFKPIFKALKSDNIYYQYIALNRLVETYNYPTYRAEAIKALKAFLDNPEPKLADAAAFSLDILQDEFNDSRLVKMANGRIYFTLFNDYSDYGSYPQLWYIENDTLVSSYTFDSPHSYISELLPSPDGKLLAICLNSYKSTYIIVADDINGYISNELIDTARIIWAAQNDYPANVRIDYENYSYYDNVAWADNNTLVFTADISYNATEFFDQINVRYTFDINHLSDNTCFTITPTE
jgi:hypothetical protein